MFNTKPTIAPSVTVKPTLEFFPESGEAVAGVKNKIAFKATDQWGRPVKITGAIYAADGKWIESLNVIHDGMGFVQFIPEANTIYTAKWKDENNNSYTTLLPSIKNSGAVLQVQVLPQKRILSVLLSADIKTANDSIYCVGTMYQKVVFILKKSIDKEIEAFIPADQLPSGILTITVFDKNWKPLAERITYINNEEYLISPIQFNVEKRGLKHRGKNEVSIALPDTIATSLSVSVTDKAIGRDSSENILSRLMLTSELKGRVHHPAYYFRNNSDTVQQHFDLVMLTNGWRRFNWDVVMSGHYKTPKYNFDSTYLSFSGKVLGHASDKEATLIANIKPKDKPADIVALPVASNGYFNDANRMLFDTVRVTYSLKTKSKKTTPKIDFLPNRLIAPDIGSSWKKPLFPNTTDNKYYQGLANKTDDARFKKSNELLDEVVVKAEIKTASEVLNERYTNGLFKRDGIVFDFINEHNDGYPTVIDFLIGKVAGLQVIPGVGSIPTKLSWRGGAPDLFIDEQKADIDKVEDVVVSDIAMVKVFRPPFVGSIDGGAGGAVAIYTKTRGDIKNEAGSKTVSSSLIEGYSEIKNFYEPNYLSAEIPENNTDVRTTIYWNPNVVIDPKTRKTTLEFYNNDVTEEFRIVIQGMTIDGRLVNFETTIE